MALYGSDEYYIEPLQRADAQLDEPLSKSQYDELREPTDPASDSIKNHFDGWDNAKLAAGIELSRARKGHTIDEVAEAILRVEANYEGESLPMAVYDERRHDDEPKGAYISVNFGWNAVKEKLGLPTRRQGGGEKHSISREEYIDALQFADTCLGDEPVSYRDYSAVRDIYPEEQLPHPNSIIDHFGGWNAGKDAAGVS